MQDTPILAVIPLYNARSYIVQAVNSILEQTYPHFCLLVINDGSTDGGEQIVAQIKDPRIILWHQSNHGPGSTMNRAIIFAKENGFSFIARMDSDDVSLPKRFEIQLKLLNSASSNTAACSSNCYYIDEKNGQTIGTSTVPRSPTLIRWEIQSGLRGLIQGALFAKTEALWDIGGYRDQFILAEDTDLFMRLSERYTLLNVPDYLYKIRLRPNSLSLHDNERSLLYMMYSLNCLGHRKRGQTEQTFSKFRANMGISYYYRIWRERWVLRTWRRGIKNRNILLMLIGGVIDPRRVISRALRWLDTFQDNYFHNLNR